MEKDLLINTSHITQKTMFRVGNCTVYNIVDLYIINNLKQKTQTVEWLRLLQVEVNMLLELLEVEGDMEEDLSITRIIT